MIVTNVAIPQLIALAAFLGLMVLAGILFWLGTLACKVWNWAMSKLKRDTDVIQM